jgi:ATP phosphoribosyltransferase regulatory subunit
MRRWVLPEYIEDILPSQASAIEGLRRRILDLFRSHGYELVMPPMLEYLESLLTGTGHDLDLRTFKLVDQLSGRLLGLRADITPQVARIDAHLLNREGVTRLCYAGSVAHAQPSGLNRTRKRRRDPVAHGKRTAYRRRAGSLSGSGARGGVPLPDATRSDRYRPRVGAI